MTKRIDHAAEARRVVEQVEPGSESTYANAMAYAQAHAILALVEQQRIANLIALFAASNTEMFFGDETWGEICEDIKEGLGYEDH